MIVNNKILYSLFYLFFATYFYSQKKESLQNVDLNQSQDRINQDLMINYLLKRKELKEVSNIDRYEDLIITEIFGGVDTDNGICLFTTTKSHSQSYIYIDLNSGVKILNLNNLNETLSQILLFSVEKRLDDKQQIKLIKRILELFERKKK